MVEYSPVSLFGRRERSRQRPDAGPRSLIGAVARGVGALAVPIVLAAAPAPAAAQCTFDPNQPQAQYAGEALIGNSPCTPSGDRLVNLFAPVALCRQLREITGVDVSQFLVHRLDTPKGEQMNTAGTVKEGLPVVSCIDDVAVIQTQPAAAADAVEGFYSVTRYTNQRFDVSGAAACAISSPTATHGCAANICKTFVDDIRECRRISKPGTPSGGPADTVFINKTCGLPTSAPQVLIRTQVLQLLADSGFSNPQADYLTLFNVFGVAMIGQAALCVFPNEGPVATPTYRGATLANIDPLVDPFATSDSILDLINAALVQTSPCVVNNQIVACSASGT